MASHIFCWVLQIISVMMEKYFLALARVWLLRRRTASCNLDGGQSSGSSEAPPSLTRWQQYPQSNSGLSMEPEERKSSILSVIKILLSSFLHFCYDASLLAFFLHWLISYDFHNTWYHWRFFAVCRFLQIGQLTDWLKVLSCWVIRHIESLVNIGVTLECLWEQTVNMIQRQKAPLLSR